MSILIEKYIIYYFTGNCILRKHLNEINIFLTAIPNLSTYPREIRTCLHKNLNMNVYSSFIHNYQKNENNPMFFNQKMDYGPYTQWNAQQYKGMNY